VRSSLGAFLLDALEPAERAAVERHVERCPACRRELERMAALPALLAIVPPVEAHGLSTAQEPSTRLLDRMLAAAGEPRARGHGLTAVLSVALLVVLGGSALLGRDALRSTITARDPATNMWMAAQIATSPWGAGVELRLSGVAAGERCRLVVRGADGRTEVVSRWQAGYAGSATVEATTSIAAVSELSVVTDDGRVLLRAAVR
jgi:anti-sigma factor RsiW